MFLKNLIKPLLLLLIICFSIYALEKSTLVFSLTISDPWAMVIGSDSPAFSLYNEGLIIFLSKDTKGKIAYFSVKLVGAEFEELKRKLEFSNEIAKSQYSISNMKDQPTTTFNFQDKSISVYGKLISFSDKYMDHKELKKLDDDNKLLRVDFPIKLDTIYNFIISYDNKNKKEWFPEYIEVMFWPFEYAKRKSIIWPKEWPGLNDAKTLKRNNGLYCVFLPSVHFPELIRMIGKDKSEAAVEINGKKMAISYRFSFP